MVGDMVSSCPLHISKVFCVMSLSPAISKNLKAFLYGWLPLSDASGIFFANCLCLLPLASSLLMALWHHSLHETKQSKHARAAV